MEDTGGMKQELQLQLHKLRHIKSEETLNHILSTLWNTRKTGLPPPDKSHFQSLLKLSSHSQLDPVLACLRWLIRKFVYRNWSDGDLLELLPADLPLQLRTILSLTFQKNRDRWKQDISSQLDLLPRTRDSYQVRTHVPPSFSSVPSSLMSTSTWPRQDHASLSPLNCGDLGVSTPLVGDVNESGLPACFQCDIASSENLLQDYSKSQLGETELKFQLTEDTLEAMLRSMTYISEQLSAVGTASRPANKKQKK